MIKLWCRLATLNQWLPASITCFLLYYFILGLISNPWRLQKKKIKKEPMQFGETFKSSYYQKHSLRKSEWFPTSLICLCAVLLWKNHIQVQNITCHSLFDVQYNVIIRRDICDEGMEKDYPMCPRCDQRCPYWPLSETCIYSKVCNAMLCPCYEHYAAACYKGTIIACILMWIMFHFNAQIIAICL